MGAGNQLKTVVALGLVDTGLEGVVVRVWASPTNTKAQPRVESGSWVRYGVDVSINFIIHSFFPPS